MKRIVSLILVCALMASCFGRRPGTGEAAPKAAAFPTVTVPGVITDPAEATTWIAEHFFDEVTTVTGLDSTSLEQAVGTWTSLLTAIPPEKGGDAVKGYLARLETLAGPDATRLNDLVERYMYDPNSPVRNDQSITAFLPWSDQFKIILARIGDPYLLSHLSNSPLNISP